MISRESNGAPSHFEAWPARAAGRDGVPESPQALQPTAFLWNVPIAILALLIINHFARPFEFILIGYKIPFALCVIGIFAVVAGGGLKTITRGPGLALLCLVGWMLASVALSTWRGGSASYVAYFVGLQIVLFLLAAKAPRSFSDIRVIGYIILASSALYLVIGTGTGTEDRLDLKGTFGNADDVALLAGFIIPFLILLAQRLRNPLIKAIVMVGGCAWLVRAIGLTGTRTGLLAIAAMILVYMVYGTTAQRAAIVVSSVVGVLLMAVFLPSAIMQRFATTFTSLSTETVSSELMDNEAYASVAERRELIRDAITVTLRNPIFGVGPGEFPDYRYQFLDPLANGAHRRFFPSHNTYLEVSSEEGLPGLACYLAFLGTTFMLLRRSYKLNSPGSSPDWESGRQISICLQAAFVYFIVCAAFMTCERHPQQYAIAGLAVALERISSAWVARRQKTTGVSLALPRPMPVPLVAAVAPVMPQPQVVRSQSALRRPR